MDKARGSTAAHRFSRVGGRPALDFPATLRHRLTEPTELLRDPGDLEEWSVQSGLCTVRPRISEPELALAKEMREALYRLLYATVGHATVGHATVGHATPSRRDVALLNEHATAPPPIPRLVAGNRLRVTADAGALVAAVARDAVSLIGGQDRERIRKCEASDCSRYFVDNSRTRRRRWCAMDRCGNRAKVAEHRNRARSTLS
jgi:predicted RNA-binding Zn ribbon-like protein